MAVFFRHIFLHFFSFHSSSQTQVDPELRQKRNIQKKTTKACRSKFLIPDQNNYSYGTMWSPNHDYRFSKWGIQSLNSSITIYGARIMIWITGARLVPLAWIPHNQVKDFEVNSNQVGMRLWCRHKGIRSEGGLLSRFKSWGGTWDTITHRPKLTDQWSRSARWRQHDLWLPKSLGLVFIIFFNQWCCLLSW